MMHFLVCLGYVTAGLVAGVVATRFFDRRHLIRVGRAARAPVCNSCPFVTEHDRAEIEAGRVPPLVNVGTSLHVAGPEHQ